MLKDKNLSLLFTLGRPLSPAYGTIMKTRAWAYKKGYLATKRLSCPVISIGNLSLGGTGKTPHVLAVAEWLKAQGIRPAVVSRGYGGSAGRGPLVVSDGNAVLVSSRDAGDEPVMMAKAISDVPVVVGSDRYAGGRLAVKRFGAELVVLDDGFQHMGLYRDVDIVLLPATDFFGTRWVFPGGDLREPVSALSRATAILMTRAEVLSSADRELARREIQDIVTNRPVFLSEMQGTGFCSVGKEVEAPDGLKRESVFAFCALADPGSFFATLRDLGVYIKGKVALPDHHPYNMDDLKRLMAQAGKQEATALVTTDKDKVKIEPLLRELVKDGKDLLPFWVLEIEARPEEGFWSMLRSCLKLSPQCLE